MSPTSTDRGEDVRALRVVVVQFNATVGDVAGNAATVRRHIERARASDADLVVFPEMCITGYPPEDLLLRPSFLAEATEAVEELAARTRGLTAIVGFPDRDGDLHNAAAVLHDGALAHVVHKVYLPNYSVFDEERYFKAGDTAPIFVRGAGQFGVSICEDVWYPTGPAELQARGGAELLVNISASPYVRNKGAQRRRMLATRAADNVAFLVYCNLVGGQDEVVFDGHSMVFGPTGRLIARGAAFEEDAFLVELPLEQVFHERLLDPRNRKARWVVTDPDACPRIILREIAAEGSAPVPEGATAPEPVPLRGRPAVAGAPVVGERGSIGPPAKEGFEEVWAALELGLRDYTIKNGFREVVVGLSGGIDSAVTATLASDALGAEHVVGVAMPARYSSASSLEDARELARLQELRLLEIAVDDVFQAYLDTLAPTFEGLAPDVTEENLQSRIRGNVLMALSNKFGWMVVTTGNKSETSIGYSTLYGDTAGGFAPLKDVPKTLVYELARWRNRRSDGPVIPEHSIDRAPSAELKADQTDQDTLPPYEVLDPIVLAYVEEEMSVPEIVALGFDRPVVERIARLVDRAEYKRRQAPPGVKISGRAFGRDRRMPITKS